MNPSGSADGRQRSPRLAAERGLPAAFIGDAAALCIANWSCSDDIESAQSSNACCSGSGTAAAATAATAAAGGTLLLAGVGSQLLVYELPSGRLLCCVTVLPDAARLHGISWLPCHAQAGSRPELLVAVHGGRHAALLRLSGPGAAAAGVSSEASCSAGWQLRLLKQLRFVEWTMEVQLAASSGGSAQMAVGLSSNAVQLFALHCSSGSAGVVRCTVQQLGQVECSDRSLLYSMALLPRRQQPDTGSSSSSGGGQGETSWLVAAGTILHDVLVWPVPAMPTSAPGAAAGPIRSAVAHASLMPGVQRAVVAPLFRLKGHAGSVHSVRWSPCGRLLASGSDDRSLRLWSIPPASRAASQLPSTSQTATTARAAAGAGATGAAQATAELQPLHTLWGHGGRLWDCCFGGGVWAGSGGNSSSSSSSISSSSSSSSSSSGGGWTGGLGSFLVTASEDCTCRVWCLATGRQLAAVEGHRGRGPWSCALLPRLQPAAQPSAAAAEEEATALSAAKEAAAAAAAAGCYLLTGGADASIKCRTLADWLPSPAATGAAPACSAPAAATEFFTLQGLPPDPEAAEVGQGRSYQLQTAQRSTQQAQQGDQGMQQEQEEQRADGGPAAARDSRAEWARCLALASNVCCGSGAASSGGSSSGGSPQPWRRRWLYVATNRGLVHRVQLPDDGQGLPERWECIHKAAAADDARPYLALRVFSQPACAAGQLGDQGNGSGSSGSSGGSSSADSSSGCSSAECGSIVWLALSNLAGTATILLDQPGSSSSGGGGRGTGSDSSSSADALCVARWQPYSGSAGPAGVWWGSSSSGSGSGSGGSGGLGEAVGLGSRYCFTTGGKQLLTAWLLPPISVPTAAEPVRLAEAQLPFAGYANAVAVALLPPLQPGQAAASALVAVGDSSGSVTVLLLVLPGGLQGQQLGEQAGNGTAVLNGASPVMLNGSGSEACLVQLAAARRVHAGTPVRALQLRLPADGAQAGLQPQLAGAEIVTAGGDGAVHTLRLPPAAVAAALDALGGDAQKSAEPAVEHALAALQLDENGTEAVASGEAAVARPAAADEAAARLAAEACALPRLLAAASRRYEAVTHIEGFLPAPRGTSTGSSSGSSGSSSHSSGGSSSTGSIVYGFHASHFAVWDEGADAEVAQVPCGGWRRPSAADVAAADDLAFCVLHDGRLWLYRRRPDPLAPPRCLHPPHHCKEQHRVRMLALPGPAACLSSGSSSGGGGAGAAAAAAAVCCITGGEDATVRQLLLPLQQMQPADGSESSTTSSGSSRGGLFAFAGLLAEQARGTAVKCLALLPLPVLQRDGQRQWLLLSAGARQTLLLSRLRQQEGQGSSGRPLPLLCDELAVKDPVASDKRTPRSQSLKLWSDLRYLAVSAFVVPRPQWQQQQQHTSLSAATNTKSAATSAAASGQAAAGQQPLLFIVAAASDASLELLCADLAATPRQLGTGRWPEQFPAVARLRYHTCPVLSTAHCCLELPGGLSSGSGVTAACHIAFSGTTDGTVAVWDLTAAVGAAAAATVVASGTAHPAQQVQQELPPLLVLPGLHQSGVNCMAVVPAGEGRFLLITGGDDQALGLTLLQLGMQEPVPAGSMGSDSSSGGVSGGGSSSISCRELLRLTIPNAHSSALRSVWISPLLPAPSNGSDATLPRGGDATLPPAGAARVATGSPAGDGAALAATAFTVGLDQQVRRWSLQLQRGQQLQAGQQAVASDRVPSSWPSGRSSGLLVQLPPELPGDWPDLPELDEALPAAGEPWLEAARYSACSAPSSSSGSGGGGRDGVTVNGGSCTGWRITAEETGCRFTQVAEPAALDVLPCGGSDAAALPGPSGSYVIGVAGRGTELLTWQN